MIMISPDHYMVKLITEHPFFGVLDVDTFQRKWDECCRIEATGTVHWLGYDLPVTVAARGSADFRVWVFKVDYSYMGE